MWMSAAAVWRFGPSSHSPSQRPQVFFQTSTLQVAASGLGPFTYQWYRGSAPLNIQPIAGATGPSFTFTPGSDGVWFERWFYWVQVQNAIGSDDSFTATVTLLPPAGAALPGRRGRANPPVTPRAHDDVNLAADKPALSSASTTFAEAPVVLALPPWTYCDRGPSAPPARSTSFLTGFSRLDARRRNSGSPRRCEPLPSFPCCMPPLLPCIHPSRRISSGRS